MEFQVNPDDNETDEAGTEGTESKETPVSGTRTSTSEQVSQTFREPEAGNESDFE